ncbi:hypothetical protein Btru_038595 [Bulinus truncatus]|nr:hypothetical protein Btru_038595 [Bulinus truncatus]
MGAVSSLSFKVQKSTLSNGSHHGILHEVSGRSGEKSSNPDIITSRGAMLDGGVGPGQNILSLLSNAQKTYEQEHGASYEHVDPRPIKHASGDASGMSQISLDELFRTVNQHSAKAGMVDTGTDTVKHPVFARSLSVTEVEAQTAEKTSAPPDTRHPILKLISSKTVEEVEKQHMEEHKRLKAGGSIPLGDNISLQNHAGRLPVRPIDPGIDLMRLLRQGRSKQPEVKPVGGEGDSGDKVIGQQGVSAVQKRMTHHDSNFGPGRTFVPVSLPSTAHSVNEIKGSMVYPAMPDAPLAEDLIVGKKDTTSSSSLPAMLKPSDLDPSLAKPKSPPAASGAFSISALLTPQAFLDPPASENLLPLVSPPPIVPSSYSTPSLAPLNREQLQQAMLHLIKNDSNFLTTLHAAYLESFHAATSNKS